MTLSTSPPRGEVHYSITENYLYSDLVCPCCDRMKIVPGVYKHMLKLEELRHLSRIPFHITSGYRCESHNREIGGASRSWHILFATDIQPEQLSPDNLRKLFDDAAEIGFGGRGLYDSHVHLDIRPIPVSWKV